MRTTERVTRTVALLLVLAAATLSCLYLWHRAREKSEIEPARLVDVGAANTGVPVGTSLTVHQGDLTITEPGTVIDALDVRGIVFVKAQNVVIKRSIIRGRPVSWPHGLIMNDGATSSFTLEDSELHAAHPSYWINGVMGANFTIRRANIHSVIDPVHITGGRVTIEASWLHHNLHYDSDPTHNNGPSHDDSIQIQAGHDIKIVGNTLSNAHNAALQITQDSGTVANVTFARNRAEHGGCTVNIDEKVRGPILGSTVADNVFGDNSKFNCAILYPRTSPIHFFNNTFTDGRAVIATQRE